MILKPIAEKIIGSFLREVGVDTIEELTVEQYRRLRQSLAAQGITFRELAKETLRLRLQPAVNTLGGRVEFLDRYAEVLFSYGDDLRISYVDRDLSKNQGDPGLADLRWKIAEVEKRFGSDTEGSNAWNAYRDAAYKARSFNWTVPFNLDFFGDFFVLDLGRKSQRYEMTWSGIGEFKAFIREIEEGNEGLIR